MTTTRAPDSTFPRLALAAVGVVLVMSLALAGAGRLGIGRTELPASAAVTIRELRFADRADGGIDVFDGQDGRTVSVVPPGTNGFLRGVLRGLARDRRRSDLGAEIPFRLVRTADGRLSLDDPATGRRVALEVFGPDNYQIFADLLTVGQNTAGPLALVSGRSETNVPDTH
jgi:putative photosynthetic complex assembly protein